ncbi:MAG: type III secretion system chaperone [Candidatus Xiphinematobacter sp.]|nr:MAG: type III secretion system chaperone [Candidatus Xiphinematobacter sp.]QQY10416.1 MAG: type III secretion system chaperone [Candidatus Xiphinematobacter sp.]
MTSDTFLVGGKKVLGIGNGYIQEVTQSLAYGTVGSVNSISLQSADSELLVLLLKILGVKKPDGSLLLPINLIVDGRLPIQVHRHKSRWFISGAVATEVSNCEGKVLSYLVSEASRVWDTLVSIMSYEKDKDMLILWRRVPRLVHQKDLESSISLFLKELEFWRAEATRAGCTGRDSFL